MGRLHLQPFQPCRNLRRAFRPPFRQRSIGIWPIPFFSLSRNTMSNQNAVHSTFLILRYHQTSLPEQTSHEWNPGSAAGALSETASTTPLPDTAPRSEATAATTLSPIPSHLQPLFRLPLALSCLRLQRNPHALPRRPESTGDWAGLAPGGSQIRALAFHSRRGGSPAPTIGSVPEATAHESAT